MKLHRTFIRAASLGALLTQVNAADWSHLMGARHDRKTAETVEPAAVSGNMRRVWEIPTGGGFSSFVTGNGKAYTVVPTGPKEETRETVIAVDRKIGRASCRERV